MRLGTPRLHHTDSGTHAGPGRAMWTRPASGRVRGSTPSNGTKTRNVRLPVMGGVGGVGATPAGPHLDRCGPLQRCSGPNPAALTGASSFNPSTREEPTCPRGSPQSSAARPTPRCAPRLRRSARTAASERSSLHRGGRGGSATRSAGSTPVLEVRNATPMQSVVPGNPQAPADRGDCPSLWGLERVPQPN